MRDVPKRFWRKRGLCTSCGEPVVDASQPPMEDGALCRKYGEHPGLCCACFSDREVYYNTSEAKP